MKKRVVKKTGDGSYTIFEPILGEHYHSINGAVQESQHIFINANFLCCKKHSVKILEFGMGTGLNVLMTHVEAIKHRKKVYYHAIEKYPLENGEIDQLVSSENIFHDNRDIFNKIHDSDWHAEIKLSDNFTLYKENNDFRNCNPGIGYDLVYFDAFSPDVQPELWSEEIFNNISKMAHSGAILTTYSAKGTVKRNLIGAGFDIEKIPGPPGKREFIRARKI